MKQYKCKRKFIKDEKRILKLLYKKGLIEKLDFKVEELYWDEMRRTNLTYKVNYGDRSFKSTVYFPEVRFDTWDYWGECDSYSLVDSAIDYLFWTNSIDDTEDENGYPESTFKYKGREWFIKYLQTLPTIYNDSKINKVLKLKEF